MCCDSPNPYSPARWVITSITGKRLRPRESMSLSSRPQGQHANPVGPQASMTVQCFLPTSSTSRITQNFHLLTPCCSPASARGKLACWTLINHSRMEDAAGTARSHRGVKKVSFGAGKADADRVDPIGNKARETGERCSWQQTRVKIQSILSCQLAPLLQFNKCITVEFAAMDMPLIVQNHFCFSPNSVSQK